MLMEKQTEHVKNPEHSFGEFAPEISLGGFEKPSLEHYKSHSFFPTPSELL